LESDETVEAAQVALRKVVGGYSEFGDREKAAAEDRRILRAVLASLLPVPDPETPRGEWRVLDGGNVVCRHAGYDNAWAEGQCRALVEQFPDEQFRIERRAEGGEWEPYVGRFTGRDPGGLPVPAGSDGEDR